MERSMLDIAYDAIKQTKNGVNFIELFNTVCEEKKIDESAKAGIIGRFYSDLTLDGRFVVLEGNVWDLRDRYTYDTIHIDTNATYQDINTEDESQEDMEDKKEYDASVQGISVEDLNADEAAEEENKENTDSEATNA